MKKVYLIPVILLLFACNSTKKVSESEKINSSLYTILHSASYQGRETESNLIIDSQEELEDLYLSVGKKITPKINFSKSQVVALFLGTKNTGGYNISVDKVEEENGKIIIYKKIETPEAGGMATMALTNPFVIAEIHSKKEIIFK